ncbi:hypothetical protein YC2023_024458 [Brassica napus]
MKITDNTPNTIEQQKRMAEQKSGYHSSLITIQNNAVQVLPDKEAEMFLMKLEQDTDRFKWTYEQEKKLIELFDHAISMNKYTLKDPTAHGRDYIVEQFNLAFNMNITYGFFKNKLDEFKKSYKMLKFLMKSTGISLDPEMYH